MKTKNPAVIAPIIPITFVVGYLTDMAWGNKMERIVGEWVGRGEWWSSQLLQCSSNSYNPTHVIDVMPPAEADSILENEKQLLALPGKPLTVNLIDEVRGQNK